MKYSDVFITLTLGWLILSFRFLKFSSFFFNSFFSLFFRFGSFYWCVLMFTSSFFYDLQFAFKIIQWIFNLSYCTLRVLNFHLVLYTVSIYPLRSFIFTLRPYCLLILFYRERHIEKQRHRDIYSVVPFIHAFIDSFLYMPWPGVKPEIFVNQDDILTNWTTWAEQDHIFKLYEHIFLLWLKYIE